MASLTLDHAARAEAMTPADLGRALRIARRRANVTQADVAQRQYTATYISRIESGARRASPHIISLYAAACDIDPDDLLPDLNEEVKPRRNRAAERCAEAADRWLNDPTNPGAYRSLVKAVQHWRGDPAAEA